MSIATALTELMAKLPAELSLIDAGRRMRGIVLELGASVPVGYKVTGHVGRGGRTATPWVGVFHPDITLRPQDGLYVALIRHADSLAVTLTVQQGSDDLRARVGASEARIQLRRRANRIREAIALKDEPLGPTHFGSGTRQLAYAAGSIAAKTYRAAAEPAEQVLAADLTSMLRILDSAADVLSDATATEWVNQDLASAEARPMPQRMPRFVPKRSDNYVVELEARSLVKTRLHEAVVNDLERATRRLGWTVTSEHPIDLVLRRSARGGELRSIVEVKTVRGGNAVEAVRAAIGQLLTYRFQLYEPSIRSMIQLVAAFNEDIGAGLRELLSDELCIAVLWLDGREWRGCTLAKRRGFVVNKSG